MERDHKECPICYSLIVEPIKIKCSHVFCINCIEKLILDGNLKCPLDRKEYDYEKDLIYDDTVMEINFTQNKQEFTEKAKRILSSLKEKSKMKEVQILYGNLLDSLHPSTSNKHKWTCYVKLADKGGKINSFLDNLKREDRLYNILGIEKGNISLGKEKISSTSNSFFENNNLNDIIKSVTFNLHPTFNPPTIKIIEAPFQICRIGWGVFDIQIKIEFQSYLNIENIKLNHFLSFSEEDSFKVKTIYIDLEKLRKI